MHRIIDAQTGEEKQVAAPLARPIEKTEYNAIMEFNERNELFRLVPDIIAFILGEKDKSEIASKVQAIREKFGKM